MLKKTRRILGASKTRVRSAVCSASDSHARRTYEDWNPRAFSRGVGGRARLLAPLRRHGGAHEATPRRCRHTRESAPHLCAPRVTHPGQVGSETTTDVRKLSRTRVRFHIPPKGEYSPHAECMHHTHAESLRTMERGHATPRARTFALPQIVHLATLVGVPSAHESPRRTNTLDRDTRYATRTTCAPETRTYGIHPYGGPRTTHASPAAIA
ncbi:hypothetical protein C8R44DRAFT_958076 [Mycena epipterygia]|nr:hypothetical protein C8R44DRAFT_958076 [Mycena epipterygia]